MINLQQTAVEAFHDLREAVMTVDRQRMQEERQMQEREGELRKAAVAAYESEYQEAVDQIAPVLAEVRAKIEAGCRTDELLVEVKEIKTAHEWNPRYQGDHSWAPEDEALFEALKAGGVDYRINWQIAYGGTYDLTSRQARTLFVVIPGRERALRDKEFMDAAPVS